VRHHPQDRQTCRRETRDRWQASTSGRAGSQQRCGEQAGHRAGGEVSGADLGEAAAADRAGSRVTTARRATTVAWSLRRKRCGAPSIIGAAARRCGPLGEYLAIDRAEVAPGCSGGSSRSPPISRRRPRWRWLPRRWPRSVCRGARPARLDGWCGRQRARPRTELCDAASHYLFCIQFPSRRLTAVQPHCGTGADTPNATWPCRAHRRHPRRPARRSGFSQHRGQSATADLMPVWRSLDFRNYAAAAAQASW
jgi:hypothetical protein